MKTHYTEKLYVAFWFMLVTIITWGGVNLYDVSGRPAAYKPQMGLIQILLLYEVIPGALAGISGFFIGADILNPVKVRSSWHAVARGLYVTIAAWLAHTLILAFQAPASNNSSFISAYLYVLLLFSVALGWLFAAVGMITGFLLYKLRFRGVAAQADTL